MVVDGRSAWSFCRQDMGVTMAFDAAHDSRSHIRPVHAIVILFCGDPANEHSAIKHFAHPSNARNPMKMILRMPRALKDSDPQSKRTPQLGWHVRTHGNFGSEHPLLIDIILRLVTFRISTFPVSRNLRFFRAKFLRRKTWLIRLALRVPVTSVIRQNRWKTVVTDGNHSSDYHYIHDSKLSMKRGSPFEDRLLSKLGAHRSLNSWSDVLTWVNVRQPHNNFVERQ